LRFYTKQEFEDWLSARERMKPDDVPNVHGARLLYPSKPHQMYSLARWVATHRTFREPTLLWITESGIWRSNINLHLYYKLRQAYGDFRLLHEGPGHLFLGHESEDLTSFLQIATLNGWGGYILTHANYVNAFFSHDEYIDFFSSSEEGLAEVLEMKSFLSPD
jgi:hypothetical protein